MDAHCTGKKRKIDELSESSSSADESYNSCSGVSSSENESSSGEEDQMIIAK